MINQSTKLVKLEPIFQKLASALSVLPPTLQSALFTFCRPLPTRFGQTVRYLLLKNLAKSCGHSITIMEHAYLKNVESMTFGDRISIHPMSYIDARAGLSIGSDVSIAHGVTIMTTEHDFARRDVRIREAPLIHQPVEIGSDVWIGAGAKLLAGVSVGDRVVIGAGAVVTRSIPSGSVAAGVPAKVIRSIEDVDRPSSDGALAP